MKNKIITIIIIALILLIGYVLSYFIYRQTHKEKWNYDNYVYVIFPKSNKQIIYKFYRPLMYIDGMLTGMKFHIGQHVELKP